MATDRGRVQVRDLPDPERIQPSPPAPSMYEGVPARPIDNNLEALGRSLSKFGDTLELFHRQDQKEASIKGKEQRLGEYYQWIAALTPEQRIAQLPGSAYYNDPITRSVARTEYGQLGIQALGAQIDKDPAWKDGFGTAKLDVRAYLRDAATGFVQTLRGNPEGSKAAQVSLDALADKLEVKHREALNKAAITAGEEQAAAIIERTVLPAILNPGDVDYDVGATLNWYKQALGPRLSGGSLDLQYQRFDELFLGVLDKHVNTAPQAVLDALDAPQRDARTGAPRPALSASRSGKVAETVQGIRDRALTARDRLNQNATWAAATMNAVAAVRSGDHTAIAGIQDTYYTDRHGGVHTLQSATIRDRAWALIQSQEAARRDDPDPANRLSQEERDKRYAQNTTTMGLGANFRLPQVDALETAVGNILANTNPAGPKPLIPNGEDPQFKQFQEALLTFDALTAQHSSALFSQGANKLTDRTRRFFMTYRTLASMGMRPEEAFQGARTAFTPGDPPAPNITSEIDAAIRREVGNYNFNRFRDGGFFGWGGSVLNTEDAFNDTKEIVRALVITKHAATVGEAVTLAAQQYEKVAVSVNGAVIFGDPGLVRGVSEKPIQRILDKAFAVTDLAEGNFAARSHGARSGRDLILIPTGDQGQWQIAVKAPGFPRVLYAQGKPIVISMATIKNEMTPDEHKQALELRKKIADSVFEPTSATPFELEKLRRIQEKQGTPAVPPALSGMFTPPPTPGPQHAEPRPSRSPPGHRRPFPPQPGDPFPE